MYPKTVDLASPGACVEFEKALHETGVAVLSLELDSNNQETLRAQLIDLAETLLMWVDLCGDFHFDGTRRFMDLVQKKEISTDYSEGRNLINLFPVSTQVGSEAVKRTQVVVRVGEVLQEVTKGYYKLNKQYVGTLESLIGTPLYLRAKEKETK